MTVTNLPPLHELFNRLRVESGLSYQQLADRAYVNVAHVYGLAKGTKRMSRDKLICVALAMALEVESANDLLTAAGYLPLVSNVACSRLAEDRQWAAERAARTAKSYEGL